MHPRASRSSSRSELNAKSRPPSLKRARKILKSPVSNYPNIQTLNDHFMSLTLTEKEDKKTEEDKEESEEDSKSSDKDDSKKKKKKAGSEGFGERMKNLYFGEGGSPKPEAWLTLLAAIACGYLAVTTEAPRKEIVFMTFLNDYLLKNQISEIKIAKDRRSEVFNHRAEINTTDGQRLYMVLGSQESFLAKLDQIQRQMGKQPAEFIPVKYVNDEQGPNAFMLLMAGFVLLTGYQIYRGVKPPSIGGKAGKAASKKSGESWFGGMN